MEESLQLALLECFKLGKALRSGDADDFCQVYDSLSLEGNSDVGKNMRFKFSAMKEAARQISELSEDDYVILDSCYSPTQNPNFTLDIYEPLAIQLASLVDQVRAERQGGGAWTSDSGALSDYESEGEADEVTAKDIDGRDTEASENPEELQTKPEMDFEEPEAANSPSILGGEQKEPQESKAETVMPLSDEILANAWCVPDGLQKGKKIGDFLTRIKNMSPEEKIPPCSKIETLHRSLKEAPILVSDLEKELFLDSSEEFSPEKDADYQHDDNTEYQDTSWPVDDQGQERETGKRDRWQKENSCNYRGRNQHYHKRGVGYRQQQQQQRPHRGGGFKSRRGGRGRYGNRAREDTEFLQNGVCCKEDEVLASASEEGTRDKFSDCTNSSRGNKRGAGGGGGHYSSPSPLVHSHNMWYAGMKSSRRGTYRHHRGFDKSGFNHFEVGRFLMEGWEQAKKELARAGF